MFPLVLLLLQLTQVYSLECYQCLDVRNVSECHNTVTCPSDHLCFTESSGTGTQMRFNLTCKGKQDCSTTTTITPSIAGSQTTNCGQCCATLGCNHYLCSAGTQSITSTAQCQDDPAFGCQRVSALLNLCADIQHAKVVCRKFCGLCDLVDGGWSSWNSWSACDVTCGNGTAYRSRTCTNPSPAHGGLDCPGTNKQTSVCQPQSCPVPGGWSAWSPWDSCSESCDVGLQRRDRSCSHPYLQCLGDKVAYQTCFDRACSDGAWSAWSPWGVCSTTCNGGLQSRTRTCNNPPPSRFGRDCRGTDVDKQLCNGQSCPATNGAWSPWSTWGVCSTTCNGGLQSRTRTCNNPAPSQFGRDCRGTDVDIQICNGQSCPASNVGMATNGDWSPWSAWGACSSTCNGGLQSRTRACNNPAPSQFGRDCRGTDVDKQLCNGQSCPATNGAWSAWSSWGACSATCNGGLQSRTRACNNPPPSQFGRDCRGTDVDIQICNGQSCPGNGQSCPEKAVAFSVNSPTGSLTSSLSPIFSTTLVNTGHYNLSTGKFTCPVAGIYSFSVTLLADSSSTSDVWCDYRVNGSYKALVRSYHEAYDTASSTLVVTLDVGDVVYLDCGGWDGVEHGYATSFSGVLITAT